MNISHILESVLLHREVEFIDDDFAGIPVKKYISYISPTYARILNTFNNGNIWRDFSPEGEFKALQATIPKTKINTFRLFNAYTKRPPKVNNQDYRKTEWVMTVYQVSEDIAKGYLEIEEFSKAVSETMFK